jgi:hypothetical protein
MVVPELLRRRSLDELITEISVLLIGLELVAYLLKVLDAS